MRKRREHARPSPAGQKPGSWADQLDLTVYGVSKKEKEEQCFRETVHQPDHIYMRLWVSLVYSIFRFMGSFWQHMVCLLFTINNALVFNEFNYYAALCQLSSTSESDPMAWLFFPVVTWRSGKWLGAEIWKDIKCPYSALIMERKSDTWIIIIITTYCQTCLWLSGLSQFGMKACIIATGPL